MDKIRGIVAQAKIMENDLLATRCNILKITSTQTRWILTLGTILSIIFSIFTSYQASSGILKGIKTVVNSADEIPITLRLHLGN
jgi:hypothetical protein